MLSQTQDETQTAVNWMVDTGRRLEWDGAMNAFKFVPPLPEGRLSPANKFPSVFNALTVVGSRIVELRELVKE